MTAPGVFVEDKIRFEFDPGLWIVEKWDDSQTFLDGIRKLNGKLSNPNDLTKDLPQGTKAIDFVGVHADALYLFEVKDFRGYQAANAHRQEKELALEIGLKVRDTLAGILGVFSHDRSRPAWAERAVTAVYDRKRPVHVVAWIAEDPPRTAEARRKQATTVKIRSDSVLQRLAWLTRHAWVDNPLDPSLPLPGIQARAVRAPP